MRKKWMAAFLLGICLSAAACGSIGEGQNQHQKKDLETESSSGDGDLPMIPSDDPDEDLSEMPSDDLGEDLPEPSSEVGDQEQPETLTEQEISMFTEFIQDMANYGFLLSDYGSAEFVDLGEVFYSGAGIAEEMTEEDVSAYLRETGFEEMNTDCVKLSKDQIDQFLLKKIGITLDEVQTDFAWVYVEENDAYYQEAGDTNYVRYHCTKGTKDGDRYTLLFEPEDDGSGFYKSCETVLEENDGDYQFISNHRI